MAFFCLLALLTPTLALSQEQQPGDTSDGRVPVVEGVSPGDDRVDADGFEDDALIVHADSFSRAQVVAIGRDLHVSGTVYGNAAVLRGDALVSGRVGGDLVVLEGSVRLLRGAEIGGDVVALGGVVEVEPGASIEGRTLAYPTASRSLLALAEVPTLGGQPVLLSAKLGLLLAWWLGGVLLVSIFAGPISTTSEQVKHQPMSSFFLGLSFLLAGSLGFLLLSAVVPALLSLPLVVLFVLTAFVLKIWGTVAVALALGDVIRNRLDRGPSDVLGKFVLGLLVVGTIKLLPWVGALVWSALSLVGMGAAFRSMRRVAG